MISGFITIKSCDPFLCKHWLEQSDEELREKIFRFKKWCMKYNIFKVVGVQGSILTHMKFTWSAKSVLVWLSSGTLFLCWQQKVTNKKEESEVCLNSAMLLLFNNNILRRQQAHNVLETSGSHGLLWMSLVWGSAAKLLSYYFLNSSHSSPLLSLQFQNTLMVYSHLSSSPL